MKIRSSPFSQRRRQSGSVVLVFITLLGIMVLLAKANDKAVSHLHQEIKRLEQRQVERLNASQTNAVSIAESPAKPEAR